MNLHDNRNSTKQAIQNITDITALQNMVAYLTEKVSFYSAQLDIVKRDKERLVRKLGKLAKKNIRYIVVTPDGFELARYQNMGSAENFKRKCVGFDPNTLSIKEEVTES